MIAYRLRIVFEPGPDPVTHQPLGRDEEVVTVEAASVIEARSRALLSTSIRGRGRLVRVFDAATDDEVSLTALARLRPGRFEIDGLDGQYDGFSRGESWNGFAVPYFSFHEARRIARDYAAQPAGLDGQPESHVDEDRAVVRLFEPSCGEWDEYEAVDIDGRSLYPVGTNIWTWREVGPSEG